MKNVVKSIVFAVLSLSVWASVELEQNYKEVAKDKIASYDIRITGDGDWTATTEATWIKITHASGDASSRPTFRVTSCNYSTDVREAVIMVNELACTVRQLAYDAVITPTSVEVGAAAMTDAGFVVIDVEEVAETTSGIAWTAKLDDPNCDWITLTPPSGAGDGQVSYRVSENTNTFERIGTLTIAGQRLTITQAAAEVEEPAEKPVATLAPVTFTLSSDSQEVEVSLTAEANASWTIENPCNWINVFNAGTGMGNATLSLAIAANSSVYSRQGILTIGGATLTIIQKGTTDYTLTTDPASGSFGYVGGTKTISVNASDDLDWTVTSLSPWLTVQTPRTGSGDDSLRYQVSLNMTLESRESSLEFTAKIPYPEIEISRGLMQWTNACQALGYAYDDPVLRDAEVMGETEGVWFKISDHMNSLHRLFDLNAGAAGLYVTEENRLVLDDPNGNVVDLKFPVDQNVTYDLFVASSDTNTVLYGGIQGCGAYRKLHEIATVLKITGYGRSTKPSNTTSSSEELLTWGTASSTAYYYWTRMLNASEMLNMPSEKPTIVRPAEDVYANLYSYAPMDRQYIWTRDVGEVAISVSNIMYTHSRNLLEQNGVSGGLLCSQIELWNCYSLDTRGRSYYDEKSAKWIHVDEGKGYFELVYGLLDLWNAKYNYGIAENARVFTGGAYGMWIKVTNLESQHMDIFQVLRTATGTYKCDGWDVFYHARKDAYKLQCSSDGFRFVENGVETQCYRPSDFNVDDWMYVTVTFNGDVMTLYVNGVDIGNVKQSGYIAFCLDAWCAYGNDGKVVFDDIKTFDACLTTDQIKEIYNLEKPPLKFRHTVTQDAATPSLSETAKECASSDGSYSVDLTLPNSRIKWTASSDVDWIVLSETNGTGSATIHFTVAKNVETQERRGVITIAGIEYEVIQKGTGISFAKSIYEIAYDGSENLKIPVIASDEDTHWVVTKDPDRYWWLDATDTPDGYGSTSVSVWGTDNRENAMDSRYGILMVSGVWLYIFQRDYELTVTPSTMSCLHAASSGEITVTTEEPDCGNWQAITDVDWISLTGAEYGEVCGTGNGTVQFSLLENTTGADRVGRIVVAGETCVITQTTKGVVTALVIDGPDSVLTGTSTNYVAKLVYSSGWTEVVTPTWSVPDCSTVTLSADGSWSSGSVSGEATINAAYTIGGIEWRASHKVTMTLKPVQLEVTGDAKALCLGETRQLAYQVTYTDDSAGYVTPTVVSVASGDATIDAQGVLVAGNTTGAIIVKADYSIVGVTVSATYSTSIVAPTVQDALGSSQAFNTGSWKTVGAASHTGDYSMKAGPLEVGETVEMSTSVTGAGTLSCWLKASTAANANIACGEILIDGVVAATIKGVTDWTNVVCSVSAWGTHQIVWRYRKIADGDCNDDCIWLDDVVWTATEVVPSSLSIQGDDRVVVDGTIQFTCSVLYNDGSSKSAAAQWSVVSGSACVEISSTGLLTAKKNGTATIRASYTENGVTVTADYAVTILRKIVKLEILGDTKAFCPNETRKLSFQVTYSDGLTEDVMPKDVSVTAGDATLDEQGVLTAGNTAGSVTVAASYSVFGVTLSATYSTSIVTPSVEDAIDSPLSFEKDGWRVVSADSHTGDYAMKADPPKVGESVEMRTSVTGAGTLSCWLKASTAENVNVACGEVLIDGVVAATIKGVTDWTNVVCSVSTWGTHQIVWRYRKIADGDCNDDCIWLDDVVWTAIQIIPSSLSILGDDQVAVDGTIQFACSAQYNDGSSKTVAATWSVVSGSAFATIDSSGLLTTKNSGIVTIRASYTENGVTVTADYTVTIIGSTEYFADAVGGDDAYDGLAATWDGAHGPKKTVQAAVNLAQVGSTKEKRNTVTLLPGDYTLGETAITSDDGVVSSNRVTISAPILLRSLHGRATRDTTRIVGAWDLSGASDVRYFMGPRAVRCVWVGANAVNGTRLEGLTFLRGAAAWGGDGGEHKRATGGGGVVFNGYAGDQSLVVDCAFVECTGTRGGGIYIGTAVRCLFRGCRASKFGCAARECRVYNCVFDGNIRSRDASEGNAALSYCSDAVNCTFVANELLGLGASGAKVYNCVFQGNGSGDFSSEFKAFNSAVQTSTNDTCVAATETEVFSPATGDYRLTAGATATTVGSASWLSRIPEEFRYTDYYGNVRTNADGSVYAGAVQATAVPQGGRFKVEHNEWYDTSGVITCGDVPRYYSSYEQGETWPRSVKFGWVRSPGMTCDSRIVRFVIDNSRSEWPLTNDTAWIIAPQRTYSGIYFQSGDCVYVDPVKGSDDTATNDGTSAKPWRTIQKAVDGRSGDTGRAVVIAEPGDYCEGATYFCDCSNRVHVTSTAAIRVIAKDGPATTFITGAPDRTTPLDSKGWGIGSNAVRCVSVAKDACCAFQGFTLRGGRSSQNASNTHCDGSHGAGFLNGYDGTNYKTGWLLDSVVTNCYGSRGPAIFGGIGERTYFTDCRAHGLYAVRYATLRSCLFVRMGESSGGVLGDVSYAYHCTFGDSPDATAIGNANAYNCVSGGNDWDLIANSERTYEACLVKKTYSTLPASCVKDDPYFADAANGDYRLVAGSSGMWLGNCCPTCAMDFTGKPFTLRADEKVRAGAFEELVPGVRVERMVGVSRAHDVRVVPAEGLTVTGEPYAGQACVGLVVNGVTQDVGVVSYTVTQAEAKANVPFVIEMLYPTHFDVAISGLAKLYAGDSSDYVCTATYMDGSTAQVAPIWTLVSGSDCATLSSAGRLTALDADGTAVVSAAYTYEGVTKSATYSVAIARQIAVSEETTGGKAANVPGAWVLQYPKFKTKYGHDFAAAMSQLTGKKDGSGKALNVWHDYVAGTDPTDETDTFHATIELVDGVPHVGWEPNLNGSSDERTYRVYGRSSLSGTDAWEYPANSAVHKFFKVDVAMPDDNDVGSDTPGEIDSWLTAVMPSAVLGLVYDSTVKYGVLPGTGYLLSNASATGAGDYVASATLTTGYRWSDGSQGAKSIPWSIGKASNGWISEPTLSSKSFLTGSAVTLTTGTPKFGTVSQNHTAASIKALTAGSYTLTSTVAGTANYAGLSHSISFTVTAPDIAIALPTAKSGLVYNGNTQYGVSSGTGYTITGNSAISAGSYTATATLKSGYAWSDGNSSSSRTISWSIGKATNAWLSEPSLSSTEFEEGTAVTIDLGSVKFGVRQANYTAAELAALPAGSYTFVVSVTGSANYSGLTYSIPVTVTEIPKAVTGVNVSPTYLTINGIGEASQVVATVLPVTAVDKDVTWSSGDTSIATVNDGLVTAVGLGVAQITVTTHEGNYSAGLSVTVASDCIASGENPDISNIKLYSGSNYPKSGNGAWLVESSTVCKDSVALQSGNRVKRSFDSYIGTVVYGSGTITFWWKVSSSAYDKLCFYVEGDSKAEISGTGNGWQFVSVRIEGNGYRRLRWSYNNYNTNYAKAGSDCGWVDCICWTPDASSVNPPTKIVISGSDSMTSQQSKTYTGEVYFQSGIYKSMSSMNEVMFGTCKILPIWSIDETNTTATIDPYTGVLSANGAVGSITVRATYSENGVTVSATKVVEVTE